MVAEVVTGDEVLQSVCAEWHQGWSFDTYQGIKSSFFSSHSY